MCWLWMGELPLGGFRDLVERRRELSNRLGQLILTDMPRTKNLQ